MNHARSAGAMTAATLILLMVSISAVPARVPEPPSPLPRVASVPFTLDHNRMIVEIEIARRDGSTCRARAWVDTGNEALVVAEPLARELGLDLRALDAGAARAATLDSAPAIRIGGQPLDVQGLRTRIPRGASLRPGVPADLQLPAGALRGKVVIFDYPARRLTLADPGAIEPRGAAVPCRMNPETGLFLISSIVDGDTVRLGIDNGSAGTWISDSLVRRWLARHPDWPRAHGAVGCANFFGFPFESSGVLVRIPELRIGPVRAAEVAALGLDPSLFDWYSRKSADTVSGFIGANVLRGYRLTVDFPGRTTWWEPGRAPTPNDLDIVGITLRAESDGRYTVAGIVSRDGAPAVEGVRPGDRLVTVGRMRVDGRSFGTVVDALRGTPGAVRALGLERGGRRLVVRARVMRFP